MEQMSDYEFVFISAPYPNGLWIRDPPEGKDKPTTDEDWAISSFNLINDTIQNNTFYAILGYSQGAAMTLAYLSENQDKFEKALLFSGYLPTTHLGLMDKINNNMPTNGYTINTVLYRGLNDFITTDMIQDVSSKINNNNLLVIDSIYSGSRHHLPISSNPDFNIVKNFISNQSVTQTELVNLSNDSKVQIINSNGNKYVFNNESEYNQNRRYQLGKGTYKIYNVPENHPIAILNNNKTNKISYLEDTSKPIEIKVSGGQFSSPYYTFKDEKEQTIDIATYTFYHNKKYRFIANGISSSHPFQIYNNSELVTSINASSSSSIRSSSGYIEFVLDDTFYYRCLHHSSMNLIPPNISNLRKDVTNTTNDGNYNFYFGTIDITVNDDFDEVSVYCYYHGYMGGEKLFIYPQ